MSRNIGTDRAPETSLCKQLSRGPVIYSSVALVLANFYILFGVIALDWDVFPLMFLFWCESVIIGIYNVAKLVVVKPWDFSTLVEKILSVPFFVVHYGGFQAFHGLFVITVFAGDIYPDYRGYFPDPVMVGVILNEEGLWVAVAVLLFSHGVSFLRHFIGQREFERTSVRALWFAPYGRVIIMHITILACGFLLDSYGSPIPGLVMLVVLKTCLDLWAHLRERCKLA